jgi:hypothetical protein
MIMMVTFVIVIAALIAFCGFMMKVMHMMIMMVMMLMMVMIAAMLLMIVAFMILAGTIIACLIFFVSRICIFHIYLFTYLNILINAHIVALFTEGGNSYQTVINRNKRL